MVTKDFMKAVLGGKKALLKMNQVKFCNPPAFYEIGVYDDGVLVGVSEDECQESIIVLYFMAKSISATLEVTLVRLGQELYNV